MNFNVVNEVRAADKFKQLRVRRTQKAVGTVQAMCILPRCLHFCVILSINDIMLVS